MRLRAPTGAQRLSKTPTASRAAAPHPGRRRSEERRPRAAPPPSPEGPLSGLLVLELLVLGLLVLGVVLFDDGAAARNDVGLKVRWHGLVLRKRHRERALAGGDRPQVRRVLEQRCQ